MTLSVFAENRTVPASPIVHGIAPLSARRSRRTSRYGCEYALLCDVRVNAHKLSDHVRVIGRPNLETFELPVEVTLDPVDCMACLTAAMAYP